MSQFQCKELDFTQLFQTEKNQQIFETLRRTILVDDDLDDKAKITRLVELIHAYYGY